MKLKKNDTNNAIITKLCNVRPHSNADRLQLATVLGAQVIVGLDAKDGDLVIYFDSNLKLSREYLHWNNLYTSKELNADSTQKGYFGGNGRVRAQKFRGEISNGYVASIESLFFIGITSSESCRSLKDGAEFTVINDIEVCSKYIVPSGVRSERGKDKKGRRRGTSTPYFWKHWDTKQLMREKHQIPEDAVCYIEEKIHGTSGRTGHVLVKTNPRWWQFWKPKITWKVISGTRRVDGLKNRHIASVREVVESRIARHLHKGEQVYYEIYGYNHNGGMIQKGSPYGCAPLISRAWDSPNEPSPFRVVLYRITITTLDGHVIDLSRKKVYQRAEELGLEKPYLISKTYTKDNLLHAVEQFCKGKSHLDVNTLLEGVVVWFENENGDWRCLKHKSQEFLISQDKQYEKGEGDVEDKL